MQSEKNFIEFFVNPVKINEYQHAKSFKFIQNYDQLLFFKFNIWTHDPMIYLCEWLTLHHNFHELFKYMHALYQWTIPRKTDRIITDKESIQIYIYD